MRKHRSLTRNITLALAMATSIGATSLTVATPAFAQVPAGGYVDLVAQVSPAVVTIEVEKKVKGPVQPSSSGRDVFPFEEFARRFGMPDLHRDFGRDFGRRGDTPQRGAGSGFIIAEDGVIVTNAHVVAGADRVTVALKTGEKHEAEVIGADRATDLAVLKIDVDGLEALSFGQSGELRVGEPVVAVGNPFGLGQSVTTGIVSALGRDIQAGPFDNFIQTDAAINRGNSGGPLLNEAGEVIGINTAIFSPSGGSVGLGFAVPSDLAVEIVAELQEDGTVDRGFLGVRIAPLSEDVVAALGLGDAEGVMIAEVTPDTAADEAGLRKGDIVLGVDGTPVRSPRDLTRAIAQMTPGAETVVNILRAGEKLDVDVTLGNRSAQDA